MATILCGHAVSRSVQRPGTGGPPAAAADPGQRDIDRPLNERGQRNAPEMGARLVARGQVPGLIISSPARRALTTAQLLADACGIARADIRIVDALYEASTETWLKIISDLPGRVDAVLMVGHNPELTALANLLCHQARIDNLPTCAVLRLDYAARNWSALARSQPADWDLDYPRRSG
jgi:phosphohistidine phosphatase